MPSIFPWTSSKQTDETPTRDRIKRMEKRKLFASPNASTSSEPPRKLICHTVEDKENCPQENQMIEDVELNENTEHGAGEDTGPGTGEDMETKTPSFLQSNGNEFINEVIVEEVIEPKNTPTPPPGIPYASTQTSSKHGWGWSIHDSIDDPKFIQHYTGFKDYHTFTCAFNSLGPAAHSLEYYDEIKPSIEPMNQFFLVVMKIRCCDTNYHLSNLFKISTVEVYSLFVTWVRFMSLQWQEIDIWSCKELVNFFMPSDFKKKFSTTRSIWDGCEIPIMKSSKPVTQQATFSHYKNRPTAKCNVCITPGGLMHDCSCAFGGAFSDRQIVERSNLVERLDPKDSVMLDKGYDVIDLFLPRDIRYEMPTKFSKKNRMTGKQVVHDRRVSSKRVHVERVINVGKTYKIMKHPLNHTESMLASDIMFVCFMMYNFRPGIISRNA